MVSTRSHSVLSKEGDGRAHDTAGEVNSAAGPTPRRSGRLRSGGGAAAGERAPPASTRSTRSRRPLKAIEEEEQPQAAGDDQQQEQQAQQEGGDEQASPCARRRRSVAAASEEEAAGTAEEEGEAEEGEPLKAGAAVVDLLAQEMFAALDGAFGEQAAASSGSDSEEEEARQRQAAAGGSSDEGSEGEGEGADHSVPAHLRWRPELALPGGKPQRRGGQPPAGAPAPGVHAVQRTADGLHVPQLDARAQQKAARKAAPDTAGKGWFDLPATQVTDEVKRDLRMLRLRGAMDPKAFYKKLDATKFPKYFQMGTVVEGAADFYSARLTNKQRKRTFTDEIMADPELAQARKRRFNKLQEERGQWSQRKAGRKTSNERRPKAHHRPKH